MSKLDPEDVERCFVYLDALRESGVTNMFGAAEFLVAQYDLSDNYAKNMLMLWMSTFTDEDPVTRAKKAVDDKEDV
tara:strand:- start:140 stop:367 length:228 start_codon:yes stop_codon:yes gene_type:complete